MLSSYLLLLIISFFVGSFGTLIGIGGGVILMPLLFFLYPDEPSHRLTAISLLIVFFNATSGSIAYARKGRIDYKSGLIFSLASIPGAILGAITTEYIPRYFFHPIFATLLIATGVYLFIYPEPVKPQEKESMTHRAKRVLIEKDGTVHHLSYNTPLGIFISIFVGFLSSLLGIGGGIIHVPALSHLLHFPVHVAAATSHFILAIVAGVASLVHILNGEVTKSIYKILILIPGVVVGAQVGAYFSSRVKKHHLIRVLSLALMVLALRLFFF